MLITTCTHCLARFKVTPQQLNLRQGQVRCGHCQGVFNGFEALERFPDDDTGSRILAARAAAAAAGRPMAEDEVPEPLEFLPEAIAHKDAGLLDTGPITEPAASSPPPIPVASGEQPPPIPLYELQPALETIVRNLEANVPSRRVARAWAMGCALLTVLFAVQLAYAFRSELSRAYPAARPVLESACASVGCSVPWVNDHGLLKLEDSELLEVPGRPNEIALGARIRNVAPAPQEFPHLELTLTDLSGQAAVRRVLRPADYLGRAPVPGEVLAAGAELALQMRLETPRIKATGYELLLFYP